ncbi:MAG: hypothetical protein COV30_01240 [Candidatus Yanofskybacteria bacterium CG10_big_fil_rev_8_21_14_0_10_37_15]|uniref:Glycosyl transferase family 1 domain-containing protein n=1 Tax=Candidatus Yanofskybacteria bacterium CG10_big_fil_rev_8_21_14_0_10_37_15 TaxID=1975097 RepID=A0A2H0R5K1_9BACT|nr:MAG: hypothetical protein COV30_01240 [Candidatus Yanofskybacteria bacterium CG10_big_fil_rev_8_21_14_0_10_37_15]
MRVLYFGTYDPDYSRNAILIKGLRENGIEVLECRDRTRSFLKYINLFFKHIKFIGKYDLMIVGFPGQEVTFLAKIITLKPIVLDIFTSHFMGYIIDRKRYALNSFRARYFRFLDKWSCRLADLILLDTQAHINYFVDEFKLTDKKFKKIWLGARTDIFRPVDLNQNNSGDPFLVLFWGSFIPLQGVEYIITAAKILEKENIVFNLIGRGQTYVKNKKFAESLGLKNINFLGRISNGELTDFIRKSDVCLSTFGPGIKSEITIQNKIFETLSSKRPLVTARTEAVLELFNDREHLLLCNKTDAQDLADKILELKNNAVLRRKIAENGYKFFKNNLTEKILGAKLARILIEEIT